MAANTAWGAALFQGLTPEFDKQGIVWHDMAAGGPAPQATQLPYITASTACPSRAG